MGQEYTKWPQVAAQNRLITLVGIFTGGGAASDMTTKKYGLGIASVKYNAATGAYKLTLAKPCLNEPVAQLTVKTAGSTAAQKVANATGYTASTGVLTIFITDLATPTAKDLATTEDLHVALYLSDTDRPNG